MPFSNQDAMAVHTLLRWICRQPTPFTHLPVSDDDAHRAAETLAAQAAKSPQGGIGFDIEKHWPVRTELFTQGTCAVCGCTDDHACDGGCHWVNEDHTLCSQCAQALGLDTL